MHSHQEKSVACLRASRQTRFGELAINLVHEPLKPGLVFRFRSRDQNVLRVGGAKQPPAVRRVHPCATTGRASCRERVCQYVLISVVSVSLQKNKTIYLFTII